MDLEEIRKQIDITDENIVRLIAKRMSYIAMVAEYKRKNNLSVYDPRREAQIIQSKKILAHDLDLDKVLVEKIFSALMEASRNTQEKFLD